MAKGDRMKDYATLRRVLEKPETLAPAFAGVDKAFVLSAGPMLPAMEGNAFAAAKMRKHHRRDDHG